MSTMRPANPTEQANHDDLARALAELTANLDLLQISVAALRTDITPMLKLYEASGLGARIFAWIVTTFAAIGSIWVAISVAPPQ
jgi:hypothetical protein